MIKKSTILTIILSIVYLLLLNLNSGLLPSDDGFFYLQIAHNITSGFGSTFNNITPTNGYHPLWMLVCILLSFLSFGSKALLLNLTLIIQFVLFVLSILNIKSVTDKKGFYFSTLFLSIIFLSIANIYLTEGFLLLYLITYTYKYLVQSNDKINLIKIAFLLGLLILCRLDSMFIVFPLILTLSISKSNIDFIKLFKIFGITLLIIAPYLIYNVISYGHLLTISAEIKSYFPVPIFNALDAYGSFSILLNIIFIAYLFYKNNNTYINLELSVLIGVLSQGLFIYLFNVGSSSWYWVVSYLCNALFINELVKRLKVNINESKLVFLSLILCFSIFGIRIYFYNSNSSLVQEHPVIQFVNELKSHNVNNSKIITYDTPGRLAFYSENQFISSDGLICDFDYSSLIETKGIVSFINNNKIIYILTPFSKNKSFKYKRLKLYCYWEKDNFKVNFFSPLNDKDSGILTLNEANLVFTTNSPLRKWQKSYDSVSVWKIKL